MDNWYEPWTIIRFLSMMFPWMNHDHLIQSIAIGYNHLPLTNHYITFLL